MLADLPVLGICGWSGSGKTALIEAVVANLFARGLTVAVVKHDTHGTDVDHPGKDSDRLFQAGADVLLQGPNRGFFRTYGIGGELDCTLKRLCRRYDVVLVEGYKDTSLPKVWLMTADEGAPPGDKNGIIAALPSGRDRVDAMLSILNEWLPRQWLKTPVLGCVLIGGKSTRMGRSKHLLRQNGKTWLEKTVGLLQQVTESVAIVGTGCVPESLQEHVRLPDVPDAVGPMAGILSAMRWAPYASWLVAACDLPDLTLDALHWLLSTRHPGVWATVPRLSGSPGIEPLLAHYDFRSRLLLDNLKTKGNFRLGDIACCNN